MPQNIAGRVKSGRKVGVSEISCHSFPFFSECFSAGTEHKEFALYVADISPMGAEKDGVVCGVRRIPY